MVRRLLTPEEAAARLVVTPRWLKEAAARGDVPGIKLGKFWRFDDADLDAWLEAERERARARVVRRRS
jgi:excisionase family DNA binding protein